MEQMVLTDKEVYPSEEVIFSHIGKSKKLWISFFDYLHKDLPDFTEEWRYYNDGKSWLMKVQRKSKTVFWLSVIKNHFRVTFYFTDGAEEKINCSLISDELKVQFKDGKRYNKIRGLTVNFNTVKDIEFAKILINIKLTTK
jgi:hypothetical protein